MAIPYIPIALGAGVVGVLLLGARKAFAGPNGAMGVEVPPDRGPIIDPTDRPGVPQVPLRGTFAPGQTLATVRTQQGGVANIRSGPSENTRVIAQIPSGAKVALGLDLGAPTPKSSKGWQQIRTSTGLNGWIGVGLLDYGAPVGTPGFEPRPLIPEVSGVGRGGRRYGYPYGYRFRGARFGPQYARRPGRPAAPFFPRVR